MRVNRNSELVERAVKVFACSHETAIVRAIKIAAEFGLIDRRRRVQRVELDFNLIIAVNSEQERVERALIKNDPADIAKHRRHLVHGALVRGKDDVCLDLFLLLERASIVERAFDCFVPPPALAKRVFDIEQRLLHGFRFL